MFWPRRLRLMSRSLCHSESLRLTEAGSLSASDSMIRRDSAGRESESSRPESDSVKVYKFSDELKNSDELKYVKPRQRTHDCRPSPPGRARPGAAPATAPRVPTRSPTQTLTVVESRSWPRLSELPLGSGVPPGPHPGSGHARRFSSHH